MVAGPSDESFLPQVVGIFYAVFDPDRGPIVPYQVPENLIKQDEDLTASASVLHQPSRDRDSRKTSPAPQTNNTPDPSGSNSPIRGRPNRSISRARRNLSVSPTRTFRSTQSRRSPSPLTQSHQGVGLPYNPIPLLAPPSIDFAEISDYIIPKPQLKHRLVTCTCGRFKVLGFPCRIESAEYKRNEFIYNVGFVFDRTADLSAFEPVVRKCGRILRAAETDTRWLSSPKTKEGNEIQLVLEQMYEDLNSYSETSVMLDGINSLELSLFPFYPNPPAVEDWHVPVALVDFDKLKDPNWDITATKIIKFINGVHHVERIAELADADLDCTRLCIQHLLYYQVIMMIDIFQYSNMYTYRPSIRMKSKDESVAEECGMYVTREGFPVPSWPVLAELYSRLQPGVTLHHWMEENNIAARGIDVRRFVTFGVIKGFLRRVHRWPLHLRMVNASGKDDKRSMRDRGMGTRIDGINENTVADSPGQSGVYSTTHESLTTTLSGLKVGSSSGDARRKTSGNASGAGDTPGLANDSAITFRSGLSTGSLGTSPRDAGLWGTKSNSPGNAHGFMQVPPSTARTTNNNTNTLGMTTNAQHPILSSSYKSAHRMSGTGTAFLSTSHQTNHSSTRGGMGTSSTHSAGGGTGGGHRTSMTGSGQPLTAYRSRDGTLSTHHRPLRPSIRHQLPSEDEREHALHSQMMPYLDGLHHTDELQVRFKMGWAKLDRHLKRIGGVREGSGSGSGMGEGERERERERDEERRKAVEMGDYGAVVVVLR